MRSGTLIIIGNAHGNDFPSREPPVVFLRVAEKVRRGLLDINRRRVVPQDKPPLWKLGFAPCEKLHVNNYWAVWIGYGSEDVARRNVRI